MPEMKTYEQLRFTDDFMFCKVLTTNPDVCEKLVGLILDREVHIVTINGQKSMKTTSDGRGIRLDVYFEDDEERVYDIEMQTSNKYDLPKRTRYYQSVSDVEKLDSGTKYKELKDTYIIFICPFDPFKEGLYRYTFEATCLERPDLKLNDGSHRIFVNSLSDEKDVPDDMKAFLDYINGKGPESGLTREIDALVERARGHQEWRAEYMTIAEKMEESREEGRVEANMEMARTMIENNEPDSKILAYTKLSQEQVTKLRSEYLS